MSEKYMLFEAVVRIAFILEKIMNLTGHTELLKSINS